MSELNPELDRIDYFVQATAFPCVAAKSASRAMNIKECVYDNLDESSQDVQILRDLDLFMEQTYEEDRFRSFVATFEGPLDLTEREFEDAMWERLQALHDLDAETYEWDRSVSCDPGSSAFSFSLRGRAFFIIGLHPNASRLSRRYNWPALVFNMHEQFENLRREGRYQRMRDVIRKRDAALCGTPNPSLLDFGDGSEARQYSGRAVTGDWRCPFRVRPGRRHR